MEVSERLERLEEHRMGDYADLESVEVFPTRDEAGADVFDYIERSLQSRSHLPALGYLSPAEIKPQFQLNAPKSGWSENCGSPRTQCSTKHIRCSIVIQRSCWPEVNMSQRQQQAVSGWTIGTRILDNSADKEISANLRKLLERQREGAQFIEEARYG